MWPCGKSVWDWPSASRDRDLGFDGWSVLQPGFALLRLRASCFLKAFTGFWVLVYHNFAMLAETMTTAVEIHHGYPDSHPLTLPTGFYSHVCPIYMHSSIGQWSKQKCCMFSISNIFLYNRVYAYSSYVTINKEHLYMRWSSCSLNIWLATIQVF